MTDVANSYRIEHLAHLSGATVRTIRAYQDRGLLPRPERRGRANVYTDAHLLRLRRIAGLLDRGYTLASIRELLEAWDAGRGLGGVLGLTAETDGPWTDEETVRISRTELAERFGWAPDDKAAVDDSTVGDSAVDDSAVDEAVELGLLEPVPGDPEVFRVPSPQELAVAVQLRAAGVPLSEVFGQLRELRMRVEHITSRLVEFTTEPPHHPPGADPADADAPGVDPTVADPTGTNPLSHRLKPLAQQTVEAELARALSLSEARQAWHRPAEGVAPQPEQQTRFVALPTETIRAVERLVGQERASEFIALAAEREVRARTLDDLTSRHATATELDETP